MRLSLFAFLLGLPLALAAQDAAGPKAGDAGPEADAATLAFAAALEACAPATHQTPHPFMRGFTIEHRITGENDGRCDYTQTMPGGMHMACRLGDAGRTALAAEFREMAAGHMSGGTGNAPAWTRDCEIVTADGKRTPMGKP